MAYNQSCDGYRQGVQGQSSSRQRPQNSEAQTRYHGGQYADSRHQQRPQPQGGSTEREGLYSQNDQVQHYGNNMNEHRYEQDDSKNYDGYNNHENYDEYNESQYYRQQDHQVPRPEQKYQYDERYRSQRERPSMDQRSQSRQGASSKSKSRPPQLDMRAKPRGESDCRLCVNETLTNGLERILQQPVSPVTMAWDNPFPTFNTKKNNDKVSKHTSADHPNSPGPRPSTSQENRRREDFSRPHTSQGPRRPDAALDSPHFLQQQQMPIRKKPPQQAGPGIYQYDNVPRSAGPTSRPPANALNVYHDQRPSTGPRSGSQESRPQLQRSATMPEVTQAESVQTNQNASQPGRFYDNKVQQESYHQARPILEQSRVGSDSPYAQNHNLSPLQTRTIDGQVRGGLQPGQNGHSIQQNNRPEVPNFDNISSPANEREELAMSATPIGTSQRPAYSRQTYQPASAGNHQNQNPKPQARMKPPQDPNRIAGYSGFDFDIAGTQADAAVNSGYSSEPYGSKPNSQQHGYSVNVQTPSGGGPSRHGRTTSQEYYEDYNYDYQKLGCSSSNGHQQQVLGFDQQVPNDSDQQYQSPPGSRSANYAAAPNNQRQQSSGASFDPMRARNAYWADQQQPQGQLNANHGKHSYDRDNRAPPTRQYTQNIQNGYDPRSATKSPQAKPDALPSHPVPVRPGLMQQNQPLSTYQSQPVVQQRQHQRQSSGQAQTSQPQNAVQTSISRQRDSPPITSFDLNLLRQKYEANPNDHAAGLNLAKKLVEAASVLSSEGGRADPKTTAKNREKYIFDAHKIIKRLVHQNYAEAMFYLADCHGQGLLGLQADPKEAFNLYQSAAKNGHAQSAYRVAVCCEMGMEEGGGTKRDPLRAMQWYKRAASMGDTPAMYKMGMILLKGLLGQQKNPREAMTWLKRAAERADQENPHALHELGLLFESATPQDNFIVKDERHAFQLFSQAAELGYKYSQFRLGQAHEYGMLGRPIDTRQSIAWYSKAASQGEHQSELALSGWYLTGAEGILNQSDTEAYLWARKAAASGLAKAEYAMGYFTETGIGTSASLEEAKRWYWRAACE